MRDPLRTAADVAMAAGVLSLVVMAGFLVYTGIGVARWWARRTGGDGPIGPAAWEPEVIGVVLLPPSYQPGDLKVQPPGPAAFAAADALLDAHIRHHGPPMNCPWCGRRHETEQGARLCYELRKEGAMTP